MSNIALLVGGVVLGFLLRGFASKERREADDEFPSRKRNFGRALNRAAAKTDTADLRDALQLLANPPKVCGDPVWMAEFAQEALAKTERKS